MHATRILARVAGLRGRQTSNNPSTSESGEMLLSETVSRRCGSVDDGPIDRGHDGVYPSIDISCKTMERSKPSFSQA
jgi:hypothetical protein